MRLYVADFSDCKHFGEGQLVPLGIILHIVVQQKTKTWGQTKDTPGVARFMGALELLWWFALATAAASIPYFEHQG
jgi:hypothetical protein